MTVVEFGKCKVYEAYCSRYQICMAEGQLNSDIEATKEMETSIRRKYSKENNEYLQKCINGDCQKLDIIKTKVERLNQ